MMAYRFPGRDWTWPPEVKTFLNHKVGRQGDDWDAIQIGFVRFLVIFNDANGMHFSLEFCDKDFTVERLDQEDTARLIMWADANA